MTEQRQPSSQRRSARSHSGIATTRRGTNTAATIAHQSNDSTEDVSTGGQNDPEGTTRGVGVGVSLGRFLSGSGTKNSANTNIKLMVMMKKVGKRPHILINFWFMWHINF